PSAAVERTLGRVAPVADQPRSERPIDRAPAVAVVREGDSDSANEANVGADVQAGALSGVGAGAALAAQAVARHGERRGIVVSAAPADAPAHDSSLGVPTPADARSTRVL